MRSFWDIYTKNEDKRFNNNYISINGWALFYKNALYWQNLFLSMKLFGDRTIRERITKLSEYISFCWAFLYSVWKDWKTTKKEINVNSRGYARGGIMHNHITAGVGVEVLQGV